MSHLQPGPRLNEVLQIAEFPGGKILSQFRPAQSYRLRIAFSSDGHQIVSVNSGRRIIRRDVKTGEILTRYEPALYSPVLAVALDPGGRHVAAADRLGDLLIWHAPSGKLVHRIKLGDNRNADCLKFSADGNHLAANGWHRMTVHDVESGKCLFDLGQSAKTLRWSDDGKTITTITPVSVGGGVGVEPPGFREIYPAVHVWDWRGKKRLRSLQAPRPSGKKP